MSDEKNNQNNLDNLNNKVMRSVNRVAQMKHHAEISQSVYAVEECAELIKAVTKNIRHKGTVGDIVEEACDVVASTLVLLKSMDVSDEEIGRNILAKTERALERVENNPDNI